MELNTIGQMKSKQIILLASLFLAACAFVNGCGQNSQEEKVYRIGILSGFAPFNNIAQGFKEKMTELGYVEGKNIIYDFQVKHADLEGG